jgi:catechol 2,3-dioxygenase-like lactoylglutathione lyase family enzyme
VRVRSFSHVAITVSDFNQAVQFYWEVFGAPLVGVSDTPAERVRSFFGVDASQPTCKIGWIRVPGGATIEIFEFQPYQPPVEVVWNRIGATHISFNVHDTDTWHHYLLNKGLEIVAPPEKSPHGHTFFFVKDPDGNLIELIDTKHMRHVLRWLGPFGAVLFRHSLYKKYYWPKTPT